MPIPSIRTNLVPDVFGILIVNGTAAPEWTYVLSALPVPSHAQHGQTLTFP